MKKASASIGDSSLAADDPNEKPYPGYAREAAALEAKRQAAERGSAAPLPGPLRGAFAGEPLRLHGFTFQPVCAWLIAILVRIDSPLLEVVRIYRAHGAEMQAIAQLPQAEQAAALKAIEQNIEAEIGQLKSAPDAALETVFAFVTDVEKCQELLDHPLGRIEYAKAARKLLGRMEARSFGELEKACGTWFAQSFSTGLAISPVAPDQPGDGSVFCQPPAEPKTASAGGSKLSVP